MGGVSRDRSLDEFLGGDDDPAPDEPNDRDSEETPDDGTGEDEPDDPVADDVEPAVSTYEFSPDGAPCGVCGAVVETRWRDDGELVCPDCKAW